MRYPLSMLFLAAFVIASHQPTHAADETNNALFYSPAKSFVLKTVWNRQDNLFQENPIIDGDKTFVFTKEGIVRAYDISSGRLKWQMGLLDQIPHAKIAPHYPLDFIPGPHPIAVNNTILVGLSNVTTGYVYALNEDTGRIQWRYISAPKAAGKFVRGPILGQFGVSGNHAVIRTNGGLTCLRIKDGAEEWNSPLGPIATNAFLVTSGTVSDGSSIYTGADLGFVSSFDLQSGKLRWTFRTDALNAVNTIHMHHMDVTPNICAACLYSNIIVIGDGKNNIYALDSESGHLKWRTSDAGTSCQIIKINNHLYVATSEGFFELDPDRGTILRSAKFKGGVFSAVINGDIAFLWRNPFKETGITELSLSDFKSSKLDIDFKIQFGITQAKNYIAIGGKDQAGSISLRLLSLSK